MRNFFRLPLCVGILLFAGYLRAQEVDAEGCKDSPLITRFPGSIVHSCENKQFEQADFPLGNDKDGNALTKHVEGEYHYWDIGTREGTCEIEILCDPQTPIPSYSAICSLSPCISHSMRTRKS